MQVGELLTEMYALEWAHLRDGRKNAEQLGPLVAEFDAAIAILGHCTNTKFTLKSDIQKEIPRIDIKLTEAACPDRHNGFSAVAAITPPTGPGFHILQPLLWLHQQNQTGKVVFKALVGGILMDRKSVIWTGKDLETEKPSPTESEGKGFAPVLAAWMHSCKRYGCAPR